jgi:hypothetical protein
MRIGGGAKLPTPHSSHPVWVGQNGAVGWRYRKRKQILPGLTLNVGKRSASLSAGPRGSKVNVGSRGVGATLTLLGTGLAYYWRKNRKR